MTDDERQRLYESYASRFKTLSQNQIKKIFDRLCEANQIGLRGDGKAVLLDDKHGTKH
jgi:hypothetical protein